MRRVDLNIPKQWIDLSNKQLAYIAKLYLQTLPESTFKVKAFMYLAKVRLVKLPVQLDPQYNQYAQWYKQAGKRKRFIIYVEIFAQMINEVQFLIDGFNEVHPLRWLRLAKPCNYRLYNITFEQYFTATNFYTAYNYAADEKLKAHRLNCFIASLYNKPWQQFNDAKISKRARYFKRVAEHKKYTVLIWFEGLQKYLKKEYPYLYQGGGSSEVPNMKRIFTDTLNVLNGGDITRNKEILKSPCHEALSLLNTMAAKASKQNAKAR